MLKTRLVAVIILRDGKVVQSVKFKHTNVIHSDAVHAIDAFSKWSVDEIVILNVSLKPESREYFSEIVDAISRQCFVPLSVGGWINSKEYADRLLNSGADKLILNSAFYFDPELIKKLVSIFGTQCITASIDVKRDDNGIAKVAVERGGRVIDIDPAGWAKHVAELGAGEILLNSIGYDGARKGYDLDAISSVCSVVEIPVVAFGGVFSWEHLVEGLEAGASAVAAANIFHYTEQSTKKAKSYLYNAGVLVRKEGRFD